MDKFEGKWVSSSCMFDEDGKLNVTLELRVISEFVDNSGLVEFETKFVSLVRAFDKFEKLRVAFELELRNRFCVRITWVKLDLEENCCLITRLTKGN